MVQWLPLGNWVKYYSTGFLAEEAWIPEAKIGVVILTIQVGIFLYRKFFIGVTGNGENKIWVIAKDQQIICLLGPILN